jgi:hypothetical protein
MPTFVLTRVAVPSKTKGKIPKIATQVAQFLATIAYQSPDVCHIIAGNLFGDLLLTNLVKRLAEETQAHGSSPNRYLPFLELLTVLACKSDLLLETTEPIGYLVPSASSRSTCLRLAGGLFRRLRRS